MSIMTRVIRIFWADLHGVMDKIEDKGLLLKQYMRELELDLQRKKERIDQLADNARHAQADQNKCKQEVQNLERDLECAIRKAKDELARLLIRKKCVRQKQCVWLKSRHDSLWQEYDQLSTLLEHQKLRYDAMKVQAATFDVKTGSGDRLGTTSNPAFEDGRFCVSEEDIELELMQRKEQLLDTGRAA